MTDNFIIINLLILQCMAMSHSLGLFAGLIGLRVASSVWIHSSTFVHIVHITVTRTAGEELPTGASADGSQSVAIAVIAGIL